MKKLNEFIIKHKKAFLFGPIILIFLISLVYFNVQAKGNENEKSFSNSAVDNSLPEANSKELPDSKSEAYDQYSDYVEGVDQDKKRNDSNIDQIGFDLPSEEKNKQSTNKTSADQYERPTNQTADRMKEMMQRLEESQKAKKRSSPKQSYNNYSSNNVVANSSKEEIEEPVNEDYKKYTRTGRTEPSKTESTPSSKGSGFFSNSKVKTESERPAENLEIYACVHTNQTVMNNQRVKLRTTKEFIYGGKKYPINTIIYGIARIRPNRMLVEITRINQTEIKLEVFDSEDSNRGLYILTPNLNASMQKELKKEGLAEEDLSRIPFSKSLKNIFEKKIKEEKVLLLNNYKVLIKISPENEN